MAVRQISLDSFLCFPSDVPFKGFVGDIVEAEDGQRGVGESKRLGSWDSSPCVCGGGEALLVLM